MKFYVILGAMLIAALALIGISASKAQPVRKIAPATTFNALVGKPAPDFTLQSLSGQTYTLSSLRGKRVVLFFSEGIMCYPACWNQIAALGTDKDLNNTTTESFSIVPDTQSDWASAAHKMPELAAGTVLLDSDDTASNKYGVLNLESSMHKGTKPGHTYVVIDTGGIVRYTYDDPTMNIQDTKLRQELATL
jgi:peroxiredoxin